MSGSATKSYESVTAVSAIGLHAERVAISAIAAGSDKCVASVAAGRVGATEPAVACYANTGASTIPPGA